MAIPVSDGTFNANGYDPDTPGQPVADQRVSPPLFLPAQHDAVSPSITTPQANSLQFKTGGLMLAWSAVQNGGSVNPSSSFAQRMIAANRMGHAGNGMIANLGRTIGALGQLADPDAQQDPTCTGLRAGKALGNATGYAIDFSRVEDKRSTVRNYLYGPSRQGTYALVGAQGRESPLMLNSIRPVPLSAQTQTTAIDTANAGSQTPAPVSSASQTGRAGTADTWSQATVSRVDGETQTSIRKHESGTQTTATQVPPPPRTLPAPSATVGAGIQTATDITDADTQTLHVSHDESVQTSTPVPVDSENQVSSHVTDGETQTQFAVRDKTTQTGSQQTTDAHTQAGAATRYNSTQTRIDRRDGATQTMASKSNDAVQATQPHGDIANQAQTRMRETQVQTDSSGSANARRSPRPSPSPSTAPARSDAATQTSSSLQHRATQVTRETNSRSTSTTVHETDTRGSQATTLTHERDTQSFQPTRTRAAQTEPMPTSGAAREPGAMMGASRGERVPSSVKANGHWLPIDILALASSSVNVKNNPDAMTVMSSASDAFSTAGDTIAVANINAGKTLALSSRAMSLIGTALGLAPSVGQLASDVQALINNPGSGQAKWNVANDSVQLIGGLLATAASFAFPPAALAPLLMPDFAEIGHAEALRTKENELRAAGLDTEADAVHSQYQTAALNSTPVINWFSSIYSPVMRPAIENFEFSRGNKPGAPPQGDLPRGTAGDTRVLDYYGEALRQREQALAAASKAYLKAVGESAGVDSVTLVSRAPQMFGWPSTGEPMRVFDRSIALTWSKDSDSVSGMFFGKGTDGVFHLPALNEGVVTGSGRKNLVIAGDMFNPDKARVKFDLEAYKADRTGSVYVEDLKKTMV